MKMITRITRITTVILLLTFGIAFTSVAQKDGKKFHSGNSVNFMFPIGDMASTYNFGWGIYGNMDYDLVGKLLAARFDLGWNSVSGPDYNDPVTGLPETPKMNLWEFTAGLRLKLAFFYIEGRGGYFTGVNSWGFVPALGLRFGRLDVQGNLNIAGDNHWGGVRLSYYWTSR
jgi:hypothetical protein